MIANFRYGRHRLSCNTTLPQNGNRRFKWWFGVICDMFQQIESKFDDSYAILVFRSFQYDRQFPSWQPWASLECHHLLWKWQQTVKNIICCLICNLDELSIYGSFNTYNANFTLYILIKCGCIWLPYSNMAAVGYTEILLVIWKMAADSSRY